MTDTMKNMSDALYDLDLLANELEEEAHMPTSADKIRKAVRTLYESIDYAARMKKVDKAFYELTVAERNKAWGDLNMLERKLEEWKDIAATLRIEINTLKRPVDRTPIV